MRFFNLTMALPAVLCYLSMSAVSAADYTFINVADTTTAAPSGTFTHFGSRSLSGGRLAFCGGYTSEPDSDGVFTGTGGAITTIVKNGDIAPIGTFDSRFYNASISGGTVAFRDTYNSYVNQGIFTSSGGLLTTIVKKGDTAPVGTFNSFVGPSLSGGTAAFKGYYNSSADTGIFTSSGGAITTIAKKGDAAAIGTFCDFDIPTISGTTAAFRSYYNSYSGGGIFTGSGGAITTIVKKGDAAPIGTFDNFPSTVAISGNTVAFFCRYNSGAGEGIFTGSGGAITTIAKKGDAAPIGTFSSFSSNDPSISGDTVAFCASYNGYSNFGIFTSSGGVFTTVIKYGDSLFGSSVTNLRFWNSCLDDAGNMAFEYNLADGRNGLAIAMAVPEPSCFMLVGTGLLGLLTYVWRRRMKNR
jgi:hypothetical protein